MLEPGTLVDHLIQVGIALTSRTDLDDLLTHIVREACRFARCDGGTVYIREDGTLRLAVWWNETLLKRDGVGGRVIHEGRQIPISTQWIAGYAAEKRELLNLGNVYELPADAPFELDQSFDQHNNYRTRSMLCVPMTDAKNEIIGVLQLVNCLDGDDGVVRFPDEIEPLVNSLASQAAVAIQNAQLHERLKGAYFDTIFRLCVAAEYRDQDTSRHIQRMSRYSALIAKHLGLGAEKTEEMLFASPMHDVGKIGIPDSILLKPGPLTPAERRVIQEHTHIGSRILGNSDAEIIRESSSIALTHHEKWDGSGYPRHLAGEQIPISGRIVALADAFDCISSARVYKPARSFGEAVMTINLDRETHFCPECVDALMAGVDEIRSVYLRACQGGGDYERTWAETGGELPDPDAGSVIAPLRATLPVDPAIG